VTWGGEPTKHAVMDPLTARISPRASFSAWQETVRGRSASWREVDLAMALALAEAIQVEAGRRTKTALLETQARLGLLAEHSGVVVALSDVDGVRSYVSPASERVLGWRPEELVGRSAIEFIHPDDRHALRDANKALVAEGGQSSASYRFRRPDGSWLWIDGHARLRGRAEGGAPMDYVVVMRDATERKATEIKLQDALERMAQMAATDGLTGLANRRQFDVAGEREWRRCARERLPLSVCLADADHFKRFNDRYGHLAGDDCLRAIATQCSAVAKRPGDIAARYGGEEFVLLLSNTDASGAAHIATHLGRLVHGLGIEHVGNAEWGVVTLSMGVATAWPGDPKGEFQSLGALVAAADEALYLAKARGRSRLESHGEPSGPGEPA
jgi:diguanylate cyclase (GGDEF)-like protein/PAS domain S-box-containing protein